MGIFSSGKKTYVTSVAYPLGEDDGEHTPYLQYTVLNAVMQQRPIAESITQAYLRGQGISLRNAFRYARDHYVDGVPESNVSYSTIPDIDALTTILEGFHPGATINYLATKIGSADYFWWGDQYLAENYGYDPFLGTFVTPPSGVEIDADVAYDVEDNGDIQVLMINADNSVHSETFTPVGLVRMADYVHVAYQTVTAGPVTSRAIFWMYQIGTGTYPDLDAWIASAPLDSPFYPSIPLRVNNVDFTDEAHQDTDQYKTSKKLLAKLGLDIEKLSESINDNEDIEEIDYCYAVFGVNLNAKSQECQRYIYRFMEALQSISDIDQDAFDDWDPGDPEPPPTNLLRIHSETNRSEHHDVELQWQYINTTVQTGEVFAGAKPGDVKVEMVGDRDEIEIAGGIVLDKSVLLAKRQIDADTYTQLEIVGLTYENFVYNGKSVMLTAFDAFVVPDEEDEEEEEGFILPLSYDIVRNTPMVELTDLSYQCNHLVFNCYKVVKQKWYQTGLFKIILVIVSIVILAISWGAAAPASSGLVGAAFTTAASLGFTGIFLVYAAATIYVLGLMILMSVFNKAAIELFGEKWGPLIAVIAAFVTMNWSNLISAAGSIATNGLSSVITAQNIMQASVFASNAYGAYAAGQMTEMQKKAMGLWTDYDKQMKEIEDLTKLNLGNNLDLIDIQGFMDASYMHLFELSDNFLRRTLITGSDVCSITLGMVENYADVGLQLPTT